MTPERVKIYPPTILIVLLLSGVVALPLAPTLLGVDRTPRAVRDFAAFYMAGHALLHGESELLTDITRQERYQHRLLHRPPGAEWSPWVYPPALAFAFVPLALMPYPWASVVELALLACALALSMGMLRRAFPELPPTRRLTWQALSFFPVFSCFLSGQLAVFFLLPLVGFVVAIRRGHTLRTGLWLGVFVLKPQLAIGLGLYLLFSRRWRAAAVAVGSAASFFALSYVLLPAATVQWFVRAPEVLAFMLEGDAPAWGTYIAYGSFGSSTLLLHWLSADLATVVGLGVLLGLAVALWTIAQREGHISRSQTSRSQLLMLAAAVSLSLLLSPHLYLYDLTLLIVPFVLIRSADALESPEMRASIALVYASCFVGTYLSMAELTLTRSIFGRGAALQLGVLAIAIAAWVSTRATETGENPCSEPLHGD